MENTKKTLQFRKKDEEVKRVRRVNQTLKNLIKQPIIPQQSRSNIISKKQGYSINTNRKTNNNQSQIQYLANQSPENILTESQTNLMLQ